MEKLVIFCAVVMMLWISAHITSADSVSAVRIENKNLAQVSALNLLRCRETVIR